MPIELDYGLKRVLTGKQPKYEHNPAYWVKELYISHPNCYYCGVHLTRENRSLDHVIPKSKGGHKTPANIRTCCQPCNVAKGDQIPLVLASEETFDG